MESFVALPTSSLSSAATSSSSSKSIGLERPSLRGAAAAGEVDGVLLGGSWQPWLPRAATLASLLALRQGLDRRRRARVARHAAAGGKDAKVVLMGDSVLDNFYWLMTPARHLRVVLEEQLRSTKGQSLPKKVVNLAVDQTTTFDFVERTDQSNPWQTYSEAREKVDFADEADKKYAAIAKDGKMRQTRALRQLDNVTWAVLSIGGNDVYLKRDLQAQLVSGKKDEVAKDFGKRLRGNLNELLDAAPDATPVLVIPYQPHEDFSLVVGAPLTDEKGNVILGDIFGDIVRGFEKGNLSELVTPMAREILTVARELECPVIDLSKTLDPTCEEHYGTGKIGRSNSLGAPWSGVEPSDVSNAFIAQLLSHAISKGKRTVVYNGVPRQDAQGDKWSLLIKEEDNDYILAEDYKFGAAAEAAAEDEGDGSALWFAAGIAIAVLVNGFSMLSGGDAVLFDRKEFETELQKQLEEEKSPKDAPAAAEEKSPKDAPAAAEAKAKS
eukprot:TRINITY_DN3012_c1_g1_i1.p1 TRINITY_DN3012_c1_g1~~TRINITY_DN3012_c1_g1_i1.p1  ORF type:complete len:497 (-),score=172.92 TRINITY_DN3012_c1_g1_i1:119-1609(-)